MNIFKNFGKEPICNHRADRAPRFGKFVFPLCYRCTFITIGMILMVILTKNNIWQIPIYVALILIVPNLIDGIAQYGFGKESTNFKRIVLGFISGIGIGQFVYLISTFIKSIAL